MSDDAVSAAVSAALSCDWEKAVEINEKILAANPNNIDCLNRLGKALLESGEKDKAIKIFKKILRINRYDPIAQKNLDRATASGSIIKLNNKKKPPVNGHTQILTTNFIEEPGRTKLVSLVNIAPTSTLLKRNYGDKIVLSPRRHTVIVSDLDGSYLGAIPDDLGHRLALLIKAGNLYDGLIKSVAKGSIVVFLRELSRTKRFKNTPSFPTTNSDYFSFVREETLNQQDKPVVATTETEDETEDSPGTHLHADEETEENH